VGEERNVSGGVFDHGTHEEDGPVTWEALASPRLIPVVWRAGDPSPTHDTFASARVVGLRGTEEAPAAREATRKGNQSGGRRGQGVGGRQRSDDVGERGNARTRPSKGGPCWCELRKGTMPNAVTLADMSRRLRKVVGRESPRVTSAEEPDGGNLLVRIWRGAGVGDLPAYSTTVHQTTAFSTDCVRPPHAILPADAS
jgi:hypothetical protein